MNVLNLSIPQGKKKIKQIFNILEGNAMENKSASSELTIFDRRSGEVI
ncbi:MAG: hypothetical protein PHU31_00900 [Anaerotignum sp.]|nr:hypothetical protein [Anaerotignum sp.]